jgi:putative PIN family toxin of toxin-antitoxin system
MTPLRRVVFDCNTLLQAMSSPCGPAGECVQQAFDHKVELFISSIVIHEFREVAARPKVARKLRLTTESVDLFLHAIEITATLLDEVPEVFTYPRDPDDAHYVNLALAAHATLIVSHDRDLLDLMDANLVESRAFRTRFPDLQIITPVEFLRKTIPQ